MITMRGVSNTDIDRVWPDIVGYLDFAEERSHGAMTADSILEAIRERDMQAMVAVDEENDIIGVAVTEIRNAPSGMRVLHIVALAGDRFAEWREEGDRVLRLWAQSVEAPIVQLVGRRGWTRQLEYLGWKEDAVMMTLDLRN